MIAQTFSRHNRAQSEGVENNLIPKKISHPLHPPPQKKKKNNNQNKTKK